MLTTHLLSSSCHDNTSSQIVHNETQNPASAVRLYVIAELKRDKDEWVAKLRELISNNVYVYHVDVGSNTTRVVMTTTRVVTLVQYS